MRPLFGKKKKTIPAESLVQSWLLMSSVATFVELEK